MSLGVKFLDDGMGYISQGLQFVRDILYKIAGFIPVGDPNLVTTIIFLAVSIWLGHLITRKFVTTPLSMSYLPWTIIISLSIFLNLLYL